MKLQVKSAANQRSVEAGGEVGILMRFNFGHRNRAGDDSGWRDTSSRSGHRGIESDLRRFGSALRSGCRRGLVALHRDLVVVVIALRSGHVASTRCFGVIWS